MPLRERTAMDDVRQATMEDGSTQRAVLKEKQDALYKIVKSHKAPTHVTKPRIQYKVMVFTPPPIQYLRPDYTNDRHVGEQVTRPVYEGVHIDRILFAADTVLAMTRIQWCKEVEPTENVANAEDVEN